MYVKLLSHTYNPELTVSLAARTCYTNKDIEELIEEQDNISISKRITDCVNRGHLSVIEHAQYTFYIGEVSRCLAQQLTRHRIAVFSMKSQRYQKKHSEYIIPPTIFNNKDILNKYNKCIKDIYDLYEYMVDNGIPGEDARYVFSNATGTNLVMSMNARELLHFFKVRCCFKAQWEIRDLAYEILNQVYRVSPIIFQNAGPSCIVDNKCPENDYSCNPKVKEILNSIYKKGE